jgi:Protein of unknown function (DUF1573)
MNTNQSATMGPVPRNRSRRALSMRVFGAGLNTLTFIWSLVLGGGAVAVAQTNSPATEQKSAPKIDFDSITYNFGKVKSGETVKHSFVFTNAGTAILEITDVKPGCGCTAAGAWDKSVAPGKTGVIPLQFNSTGYGGLVAKSATVNCNDPGRSNIILQITGTLWKPIDITPSMAMFNLSSESATNETKVLRLVSNLEEPVTLSDLECKNASFKTELKELKPGKEFELYVTAVPPFSNATVFSTITLKSSSTNAPNLSVSVYAVVQQPITVSPQQVVLPAGPLTAPRNMSVLVRNNSTNAFQVSDARLDLSGVDIKVAETQTGRVFSITMAFPSGFELKTGQKPELTFKTTHPRFPLMKVPIAQMQRVAATSTPAPGHPAGPLQPASPLMPASPVPVTRPLPASPTTAAPTAR